MKRSTTIATVVMSMAVGCGDSVRHFRGVVSEIEEQDGFHSEYDVPGAIAVTDLGEGQILVELETQAITCLHYCPGLILESNGDTFITVGDLTCKMNAQGVDTVDESASQQNINTTLTSVTVELYDNRIRMEWSAKQTFAFNDSSARSTANGTFDGKEP